MSFRPREWLLPVSGAFAAGALCGLIAFGIGPGCQTQCRDSFDCGDGAHCLAGRCESECFNDEDCRRPPECHDNPTACIPKGLLCTANGTCIGEFGSDRPPPPPPSEFESGVVPLEGWNDPVGSGVAFVVDSLAIADQSRGFDIDGKCRSPGDCVDNQLYPLGQLGNDQIRQGLLGGETLLLMEIAGLDTPFSGNDPTVTVKIYGGQDADEPFFPANNFQIPSGDNKCCEFLVSPESVSGTPSQARARAPAKIVRGRLQSLAPVPLEFTLTVGVPPHPSIRLEKVLLAANLPSNLGSLSNGLIGGAIPINTLARTDNPYCKTLNQLCPKTLSSSTLIDLVAGYFQPDVDLDPIPDGLEELEISGSGRVARCLDGCKGNVGCPKVVMPLTELEPWTCALRPEMADGYSVGITFHAVEANILGIGR